MLPRQFADAARSLLLSAASGLGPDRVLLLTRGLRSVLSTTGRESSSQFRHAAAGGSAGELSAQAQRIGDTLSDWADDDLRAALDVHPNGRFPDRVILRSRCDGHVWTPEVADLLMGRRGSPEAMQLYNEYLHQLVLLRDALLPFRNWEQVPLSVRHDGLRTLEGPRELFLAEALSRKLRHTSIVDLARRAVTGQSGPPAYGFTTSRGTALPAVVSGSVATSPRWLLDWHPDTRLAHDGQPASFVYATVDYFAAPRAAVRPPDAMADTALDSEQRSGASTIDMVARPSDTTGAMTLSLRVTGSGPDSEIDLGQAVRGHRYAYLVTGPAGSGAPLAAPPQAVRLSVAAVLGADGLLWAEEGTFLVAGTADGQEALAVLGAIYPENVVVSMHGDWPSVVSAGKAGPARFVIDLLTD